MGTRNLPSVGLAAILLLSPSLAAADHYHVIGNHAGPVTSVDPETVRNIFMGETRHLGGVRVTPVIYNNGTTLLRAFLHDIVHMGEVRYRSYWIRRVFRGEGPPPVQAESEEEAIRLVATRPGAIAFVSTGRKLPDEVHEVLSGAH